MLDHLDYTIQGGQEVYAEAGKIVYETPNVQWDTRLSGGQALPDPLPLALPKSSAPLAHRCHIY
jgi:hypothetical protein